MYVGGIQVPDPVSYLRPFVSEDLVIVAYQFFARLMAGICVFVLVNIRIGDATKRIIRFPSSLMDVLVGATVCAFMDVFIFKVFYPNASTNFVHQILKSITKISVLRTVDIIKEVVGGSRQSIDRKTLSRFATLILISIVCDFVTDETISFLLRYSNAAPLTLAITFSAGALGGATKMVLDKNARVASTALLSGVGSLCNNSATINLGRLEALPFYLCIILVGLTLCFHD